MTQIKRKTKRHSFVKLFNKQSNYSHLKRNSLSALSNTLVSTIIRSQGCYAARYFHGSLNACKGEDEKSCHSIGCCWREVPKDSDQLSCFYPPDSEPKGNKMKFCDLIVINTAFKIFDQALNDALEIQKSVGASIFP